MAMYLGGVPIFTIMLLGRWSSEAFLRYIRKQVQEFSKGVGQRMISNEKFFAISSETPPTVPIANRSFPNNIGPNFKDTIHPLSIEFKHLDSRHPISVSPILALWILFFD